MNRVILFCLLAMVSCSNESNSSNEQVDSTPQKTEINSSEKSKSLEVKYLGIYHGIQAPYFMKNQFGDDMIINGKKVPVPGIDYKFILKEEGIVNLQQSSLEDNTRYYYDGKYSIIDEDENFISITCKLSDGKSSNPDYNLKIDKRNLKGTCKGSNDPEFEIEKK
jgi:hypothetical protein